jgi:serine/threonine-protein kinase
MASVPQRSELVSLARLRAALSYDSGPVVQPPDSSSDAGAELAPGTRLLDRYTIVETAGSGGMATIYRAQDERLDRIVCVKLLRLVLEGSGSSSGHGVYEATYAHFLKEALALSKLQHPNTLRIYDFGYTEDGRPFQIAEFLEGGNLESFVRARGRLSAEQVVSILESLCGAASEAHQHGIVHRDIKPSNILFARVAGDTEETIIGQSFVPKLADFGIASSRLRRTSLMDAKEAEPSEERVVSGVALFSPRWAAPEQLSGAAEGPTTDVYALGLLTAYMLSGRAPFGDKDAKLYFDERIKGDDFAAARLASLALDARVREVLLSAMAANPAERIASPGEFFTEIRGALLAAVARWSRESITLVLEPQSTTDEPAAQEEAPPVAPLERTVDVGGRRARIVAVNEKLDITLHLPSDAPADESGMRAIRFRVALLPSPGPEGFSLHLKGLNGFVARAPDGRPTAAITASEGGAADLVSGDRVLLACVAWSFGRPSDDVGPGAGRVFEVGSGELVIPYGEASQAATIDLGPDQDLIVMCRRR